MSQTAQPHPNFDIPPARNSSLMVHMINFKSHENRNRDQGTPTDLFLGKLPLASPRIIVHGLIRTNYLQESHDGNFLTEMKSVLVITECINELI